MKDCYAYNILSPTEKSTRIQGFSEIESGSLHLEISAALSGAVYCKARGNFTGEGAEDFVSFASRQKLSYSSTLEKYFEEWIGPRKASAFPEIAKNPMIVKANGVSLQCGVWIIFEVLGFNCIVIEFLE